jgi:hypothetical protein
VSKRRASEPLLLIAPIRAHRKDRVSASIHYRPPRIETRRSGAREVGERSKPRQQ